jgi:hypothetical protein
VLYRAKRPAVPTRTSDNADRATDTSVIANRATRSPVPRPSLDVDYPYLSAVVRDVLSLTLNQLADRCPCQAIYQYFDLERLLAAVRDNPLFNDPEYTNYSDSWAQVRGYLATIDAYIGLGVLKNPTEFITKKLLAPVSPVAEPPSDEMLNTLVECMWGLWLKDAHGNIEETKPFPGGGGDADFFVETPNGPLWVDCMSISSDTPRDDMMRYLVPRVRTKWREKFGARPGGANLPAAIAVTLIKDQGNVAPALIRDEITGSEYMAPKSLWTDCFGLRHVWFATAEWHAGAHRPPIFATWNR